MWPRKSQVVGVKQGGPFEVDGPYDPANFGRLLEELRTQHICRVDRIRLGEWSASRRAEREAADLEALVGERLGSLPSGQTGEALFELYRFNPSKSPKYYADGALMVTAELLRQLGEDTYSPAWKAAAGVTVGRQRIEGFYSRSKRDVYHDAIHNRGLGPAGALPVAFRDAVLLRGLLLAEKSHDAYEAAIVAMASLSLTGGIPWPNELPTKSVAQQWANARPPTDDYGDHALVFWYTRRFQYESEVGVNAWLNEPDNRALVADAGAIPEIARRGVSVLGLEVHALGVAHLTELAGHGPIHAPPERGLTPGFAVPPSQILGIE